MKITLQAIIILSFLGLPAVTQGQTAPCEWDNPKELAETKQFDGESDNWEDLIRQNRHAVYEIYTNYQTPGIYPTGTQHLVGMDFAEDDLDLLTKRYEAATTYAKSVCDRELNDLLAYKYFQTLLESGHYSVLLDFVHTFPRQLISDSDKAKIELLTKYETSVQITNNDPLILKNISKKSFPYRITIKAKANMRDSELIFDTGGDTTSYGEKFGKKAKFRLSEFETDHKTSANRSYKSKLGFINTLSIGSLTLENVRVALTPFKPNEFWRYGNNKENFDGILGFDEIRKLGDRITFVVKNDRVDNIVIENYSPDRPTPNVPISDGNSDFGTKIFLGANTSKPYVNLKIEDQSYTCLWDTGWDVTTLSKALYDRHSAVITPKVPASRAVYAKLDRALVAGKTLPHDIRFNDTKSDSFCVVGLNAVVEAGGATWDVKNGRIAFGPINRN